MNDAHSDKQQALQDQDFLSQIRRHRLMQICGITAFGLMASLLVARGITLFIFSLGVSCLLLAFLFAFKRKVGLSAFILLISMSAMLFALSLTGAGLFDLAVLGYPGILIFAALLGGVGLFVSTLLLVIIQCVTLAWLTLSQIITPNIPSLSWSHLIFILAILVVTGFSVYILVCDIKRLMLSLHKENVKVEKNKAEIQHLAHHDSLTDLPNRLYGKTLFDQTLQGCTKNQQELAILFIDLDNFKPVNDVLGHEAGDELLKKLTQRLKSAMTPNSQIIRFGGDEFLILIPTNGSKELLDNVAESLIIQCASLFEILHTHVLVSASLGIAVAPKDGKDFRQLCRKADLAMYAAKEAGRNTYRYYSEDMEKVSQDKFEILQLMRPALNDLAFKVFYQPLIDLKSGDMVMIEALIRWPQADGTMIPPDRFIPIAEQGGLINELGRWVIEQACIDCQKKRQQSHPNLRVSVNLSVLQFKDGTLCKTIKQALAKSGLPAHALELELTESMLIDEAEQIRKQLAVLSAKGITVAIDDFGTGYSNLGYLHKFNATTLKIDRSFISVLDGTEHNKKLVKAIINMASSLELQIVAEGIEDDATREELAAMGCDIGQGYFWSKPVPIDDIQ